MPPIAALVLSILMMIVGVYFIYRGCGQEDYFVPLLGLLGNISFISGLIGFLTGSIGVIITVTYSTIGCGGLVAILDESGKVVDVTAETRWVRPHLKVQLTRGVQANASVQPITDNPKVRRLGLTVDTEIVDARRFVESMNIKANSTCEVAKDEGHACQQRDAVLFHLYEFMNSHSRELGKFYNPYDPQQTRDLEALMRANLDEPLAAKGLRLVRLAKWTTD